MVGWGCSWMVDYGGVQLAVSGFAYNLVCGVGWALVWMGWDTIWAVWFRSCVDRVGSMRVNIVFQGR
jgi:hypothetical protein